MAMGRSFGRTLHLEAPHITICVVNIPESHPQALDWVMAEVAAAERFVEVYYDAEGRRFEKVMRLLPTAESSGELPLTSANDRWSVAAGANTAECALALAKESGARLVLLGRATPETDAKLAANLERLTVLGVEFKYFPPTSTTQQQFAMPSRKLKKNSGRLPAFCTEPPGMCPRYWPS